MNISIESVKLIKTKYFLDSRGKITIGEYKKDLPFVPMRYFIVYDTPTNSIRGEHAHVNCYQFLICVSGSLVTTVDDGTRKADYLLNTPSSGLLVPPGIWASEHSYSDNAVLLVLASDLYDPNDYINDYNDFLRHKGLK